MEIETPKDGLFGRHLVPREVVSIGLVPFE
jgi:hypothetical protein